jgi:hypothetical protein
VILKYALILEELIHGSAYGTSFRSAVTKHDYDLTRIDYDLSPIDTGNVVPHSRCAAWIAAQTITEVYKQLTAGTIDVMFKELGVVGPGDLTCPQRKCRRSQMKTQSIVTLLTAAILLCSGYSSGHAQTGLHLKGQVSVFDTNGKKVGKVIGFLSDRFAEHVPPFFPVVAFTIGDRLQVLGVTRDGFVSSGLTHPGELGHYFQSNDCSGTLFLSHAAVSQYPPDLFSFGYLFANKLYVPDGPPRPVFMKSILDVTCGSRESSPIEISDAVPTRVLVDLGAKFTPPFTVR